MIVALFGHRDFSGHVKVERELRKVLEELIRGGNAVEVLLGRSGEFDIFAAAVVKRLKREVGEENLYLTLVLPYTVADIEYYEAYYDEVIIPCAVEGAYPKAAIRKRNKYMVELSDLSVFFVERERGGAYETLKYACSIGKETLNLAPM